MKRHCTLALAIFLSFSASGFSYELRTHSNMADAAGAASSLSNVLQNLQLTFQSKIDKDQVARDENDGTAAGWLREGAIREDGESDCDGSRVRNHFYNPLNNSGYIHFIEGRPSPDWGLEETTSESNEFSYRRAKNHFWSALTEPTDGDRQHELALTFRSIGQVVHLVQDAAQPQHTRNDSHGGKCRWTGGLLGPKSLYEEHIEQKAGVLQYVGYPVVSMARPRDYWDDEFGGGLAEFSNRNFVSAGTNFRGRPDALQPAPGFPMPSGSGAVLDKRDIQELIPGSQLHGKLTFIGTLYDDKYTGIADYNLRTSSYSIFNADLTRRNLLPSYTINRFNIDAAQSILIPRAVGYSAGLIDFFFRGKMEIQAPDLFAYAVANYEDGHGKFTHVNLKLRNATKDTTLGRGKIYAIVRYRQAYPEPLIDPRWGIDDVPSYAISAEKDDVDLTNDFQPLSFDFSADPIPVNAADVSILIAYRGPLITEAYTEQDGIAIGGKDLYEPDLIDFVNSGDYECSQGVLNYTPGKWRLDENYVRIYPNGTLIEPWSGDWNFYVPTLAPPQYGRVAVIQDQDIYTTAHAIKNAVDTSSGYHYPRQLWKTCPAAINRIVEQDGVKVHDYRYLQPSSFRGSTGGKRFLFTSPTIASNQTCANALPAKTPAISEVPSAINEGSQP